MKKIFLIMLAAASFIGCDSNDDGFYNTKYIDATGLAEIETQSGYNVGDVIYVNASIPNLLPEEGFSNPLNIRETTGDASEFEFSFVLERNTGGDNWQYVNVTDLFIQDYGDAETGSFIQAFPQYNALVDAYVFRGGLTLAEAGSYRLSFGYNSASNDRVEFISHSIGNAVTLNIRSTVNAIDAAGYYNFTVN